jgi:hypothetical protein
VESGGVAGRDEEGIGKTVEVGNERAADRLLGSEAHHLALGATANRAREVQARSRGSATGQDEGAKWGKRARPGVDVSFQRRDVAGTNMLLACCRRSQSRTKAGKLMLDAAQMSG